MFAETRHRQRYIGGLLVKPPHMLTLDDMAKILGIEPGILRERVFTPLQQAYEKKQARDKFVDAAVDTTSDVLHVRGKLFPAWRVGFYQHRGQEFFCVDQNLIPLCEHTLYGRLDKVRPELLDRNNLRRLLGSSGKRTDDLWRDLQLAFFNRKPYEQSIQLDNATFDFKDFGFYRNKKGVSEFFLSPDALLPSYSFASGADAAAARHWAEQPHIRQCKTSSWLTQADVLEALDINPLLHREETRGGKEYL